MRSFEYVYVGSLMERVLSVPSPKKYVGKAEDYYFFFEVDLVFIINLTAQVHLC